MKKFGFLIALAVMMCTVAYAGGSKSDKEGVYMFGVGASFGDTIVYFTDIQFIEGDGLVNKGFLESRNNYSYQLENYLEIMKNLPDRTCAVFFAKKRSKLEKQYQKLRKKYEGDPAISFRLLSEADFKFQRFEME